jgi:signal transduction histidine kinase
MDLTAPDVQVRGQAAQIESVVLNLVKNAIEAMPSRGTLRVATRPLPSERSVEIVVADTGVGIPKDLRNRIFSPFFSTKGEDGLGLGLAVVYGLVKAHGGVIEVTDNVGGGTVFRIKLPVKGGRP